MITLLTLLAGTLGSAMAASEEGRHQRDQQAMWLRHRLLGQTPRPRPGPAGIPIWVWPDGHRIVRYVTVQEAEEAWAAIGKTPGPDMEGREDDILEAVLVDTDGTPGFSEPSFLAYIDERQSPLAFMTIGADGDVWELGGPKGRIETELARARVYKFLADTQGHEETEPFSALWHDSILIDEGLLPALERIEQPFESTEKRDAFLSSLPASIDRYIRVYEELLYKVKDLKAEVDTLEDLQGFDPDDPEFIAWIHESEWEPSDPDAYEALELLVNADPDEELPDQKELLQVLLDEAIGTTRADLYESTVFDVQNAMQREATNVNQVLQSHDFIARGAHNRAQFRVTNNAFGPEEEPFTGYARLDDDGGHSLPSAYWITDDGHGGDPHKPGHIHLLRSALETRSELYAKSDEPTWRWPGNLQGSAHEVELLLGIRSFNPLTTDLIDFVGISRNLGLAHPEHIEVWRRGLKTAGF